MIQTLKGFRDFLPAAARKRQWLKNRIKKTFELWGYDPLETPTLEPLALFSGQIGEDEKLFYHFTDNGGREVALRYDQTVPACRVLGQYYYDLPLPFKRYQIQPAFRAEKPQKGRYREFLQCDADIFGSDSPYADAQVIALSLDIYRRLNFKQAVALINDRTLLSHIPYHAIVEIDKLEKIGEPEVLANMAEKGINNSSALHYLEILKNLQPNETLAAIFKYLEDFGFEKNWFKFEPSIARSFAYSTGPIWEIRIPGYDGGAVLGGERYDNLAKSVTGRQIPATGFGLGFDRTLEAAEQFGLLPDIIASSDVLVTVFDMSTREQSINYARSLQDQGIRVDLYPDPTAKVAKQLAYADRKGIPYALICGPEEIKANQVILKDLKNRSQQKLSFEETIKIIRKS